MSRTKRNVPFKLRKSKDWPFIPLFKRLRLEGVKLTKRLYKRVKGKRPVENGID